MPDGELISVTINDGVKKFSELGRHDNSNDDKSKYKKVCIGDIAYNSMRMWQGASGYSYYNGIVSQAYTVLSANYNVNSKFIAYQFKLPKMIHTFKINSQGITSDNWNLKFPVLSYIEIYISKQIEEQSKIAVFLESLDHLITLHQSKSFKCFFVDVACCTLSWEQRKLGEVANIVGGGTPSTSNEKYWDGNIDWYAPAEIGEQIYAFWSIRKITEEGLKHSSAKLLPAFKTVLFTSRAGIGNMAVLQKDGATNQGFQSIVCNDCLVPYFVFSMGFQIKKKAERVAAGSTFSEISGKQLCDLEIMVTTDKEQLKIGSYFQSLDHLITLHQLEPYYLIFKAIAYRIIDYAEYKFFNVKINLIHDIL